METERRDCIYPTVRGRKLTAQIAEPIIAPEAPVYMTIKEAADALVTKPGRSFSSFSSRPTTSSNGAVFWHEHGPLGS